MNQAAAVMLEDELNPSHRPHLFLIDGFSFLFRAYHSMPPLTRPDGTPVGAVLGFTNMVMKLKDNTRKDDDHYMAVIFDAGQKTFRNEIFPDYKANRPPPPDDLIPQFDLVREAAQAMGLTGVSMVGYEADDIIATYTKQALERDMQVTIISSDKDLMQLVNDHVAIYDTMKDRRIGHAEVMEKFGVPPELVWDAQALIGDSSDNIPGVPGIGPKTAAELINTYGNLEEVLNRASEVKQNKRRESLIEFAEQARLSRELVELKHDVPIEHDIEAFHVKPDNLDELVPFLQENGFKNILNRLGKKVDLPKTVSTPPKKKVAQKYQCIKEEAALADWLSDARDRLAITTLFDGKTLVGLGLAKAEGQAAYVPLIVDKAPDGQLDLGDVEPQINDITAPLNALLENDSILKIGHHIKQWHQNITAYDDIEVLSYILDGTTHKHTLTDISDEAPTLPTNEKGKELAFTSLNEEQATAYACQAADCLLSAHQSLKARLFEERQVTIYETMDRPLIHVLSNMESAGVKIDTSYLNTLSNDFTNKLDSLEKEIHNIAGHPFTIGSPKQLGEVLFDEMGIQGGKKSKKTGAYSTGADVLEELAVQGHDIAQKVLDWRQLSKLKSTYTDSLPKQVNSETGRVHSTFTQTVTNTGRLSSVDPNLQNIPIRTEEGRKIRNAFIAEKGNKLISADYSQIELRLLAHMAEIDALKQAFKEGTDIHALTASQVFGVPIEGMDPMMRRSAKAINFGIIYGQSAFGLAASLGISREEAKKYIAAYFEQYPGIRKYMDTTKEFAHQHGYVQTLYGRKCYVPAINAKGPQRAFAERAAINAPLQGTGADIIKRAMVTLDKALPKEAQLILQVHDELLIEAPENMASDVAKLLKKTMQQVATLSVPLTVEASIGDNWGEIH